MGLYIAARPATSVLARTGPELEGELALMAVSGLDLGGKRPREWSDDLVELSLATDPDDFMGIYARHLRAMAEGAVLIAEGDREAGVRALNEALLRLRVGMARGRARAEEEWIRELRDRARAAPTGQGPAATR